MKNLVPKVATLLTLVVFILCILLIKSESSKNDEKQRAIEYKKEMDKVNFKLDSVNINIEILTKKYESKVKALKKADEEVIKTKNELKKIKSAPPVRYTDAELDSILTVYYPR